MSTFKKFKISALLNLILICSLPHVAYPQAFKIDWVKYPMNFQLYPRDTETQKAEVEFKGKLQSLNQIDSLILEIHDSRGQRQQEKLNPQQDGSFEHQVTIKAGLHSYRFLVTAFTNGEAYLLHEAKDVVAGDAYLIYGQSNAQAGQSKHDLSPFIRTFNRRLQDGDTIFTWSARTSNQDNHLFIDALPGDIGQRFAKRIIETHGIPVAIINGAVGGQVITDLLPINSLQLTKNTMYDDWKERVNKSGLNQHIRSIIWHQGESDGLVFYCRTTEYYTDRFLKMKHFWERDFSGFDKIYMFQSQACTGFGIMPNCMIQIQEAQRQLALQDAKIEILATGHYQQLTDGCHYSVEEYQKMGDDLYAQMNATLYQSTTVEPAHININTITFANSDSTSVAISFTQPTMIISEEHLGDLKLEGDSDTQILNAELLNQQLILHLSKAPAQSFTGISYYTHSLGGSPFLANESTSLLHFYNQLVLSFDEDQDNTHRIQSYLLAGPNPVSNELEITWPLASLLTYQLLNHNGQLLREGKIFTGRSKIDFSNLEEGIYMIRLIDTVFNARHTLRIIKR